MRVAVDGVIFQLQAGRPLGISRIWRELLPRLIEMSPDIDFTLLNRPGFEFPVPTLTRRIPISETYDWMNGELEVDADLFISTYYTRATNCLNLLYIYDMIPELLELKSAEWQEKSKAIRSADKIVCMSENTAADLTIFHDVPQKLAGIVPGGVSNSFYPAHVREIEGWRKESGIAGDFVMLSGNRNHYKNGNTIFAIAEQLDKPLTVLLAGGEPTIPLQYAEQLDHEKIDVVYVPHLDDDELRAAYSSAIALYYPSSHEGFGLPVLEAMACGCPVIVGPARATREFSAGAGVFLDQVHSPTDIINAIAACKLGRETFGRAGISLAKQYTWEAAAQALRRAILSDGLEVQL